MSTTNKPLIIPNGSHILYQRPGSKILENGKVESMMPHTHIGNNVYVMAYSVSFENAGRRFDTCVAHSSVICWC